MLIDTNRLGHHLDIYIRKYEQKTSIIAEDRMKFFIRLYDNLCELEDFYKAERLDS